MSGNPTARRHVAILATVGTLLGLLPLLVATPVTAVPRPDSPAAVARRRAATPPTELSSATTSCLNLGTGRSHGAAAVARLGGDIDRAAARVGRSGARLKQQLLEDPTLWIDRCGDPFYIEPTATPAELEASDAAPLAAPSVPLADTFRLHSRPGSLRTIFLDFDGMALAGSAWAVDYNNGVSWNAVGYDTDGAPATFSDSERTTIQSIWQRMSEDYAPFDIDVTTEDPGFDAIDRSSAADVRYGTAALFTKDATIQSKCSCGGIAYVGVFDSVAAGKNQPAFVFTGGVGTGAKNLAEAASHEVGHNLGLSHDGTTTGCGTGGTSACGYYTGQGAWAPIMGVGYYKPVSQWSKGEYANANNTETDYTVMASNGGNVVADDAGDTTATATALPAGLPTATTGLISTPADVDVYQVSLPAGTSYIAVRPADTSPNLDVKVTLYDAGGAVVQTEDPASAYVSLDSSTGLPAIQVTAGLAAGTYFVGVEGIGQGAANATGYSDWGSLGRYTVGVSTDQAPVVATASLPDSSVGVPYDAYLEVAADPARGPFTWSLSSGSLPAGLVLGTDGSISGTPSSLSSATFTVAVQAAAGGSSTRTLTINSGVTITSKNLPEASNGTPYSTTLTVAGGAAAYTWALISGTLPTGLGLAGATISGTPTVSGTSPLTFRVTDGAGRTTTQATSITVVAALTMSPLAASGLKVGTNNNLVLPASGGRPPYVWSVESGTIPPGIRISDNGGFTGTPTLNGTYNSVLRVTDRAGRTTTNTLTATVAGFTFSPASLPAGAANVAYSQSFGATYTGLTAPVTWTQTGALPAGITLSSAGLLAGTPSVGGTFPITVRGTDANGWTDAKSYTLTLTDVPLAPTGVTGVAGAGQATVSWTAPAGNGGSPVTGYKVTPYIGAVAQTATTFNSTATTQTVTGLAPGSTYRFVVAAVNVSGPGIASAASGTVTIPAVAPGAPTIGTATAGDAQADLTWTAPASDGGSAITGYKVTPYIGAVAQPVQTFNSTATAQTVTGLTNGTTYTFKVAAVNTAGTGAQSAASNAVTPTGSVVAPGKPTITDLVPGDSQVTVTWDPPTSDGGSAITGYTVKAYESGGPVTTASFDASATTRTLTGLANGTPVGISVTATNGVGSTESDLSPEVTPARGPGDPQFVAAVAGDGKATVSWEDPLDTGGLPITGYIVTPYIGAVAQTPVLFDNSSQSVDVTGLANGTTYTFTVQAFNAVSAGSVSVASNAVTPAGAPSAPSVSKALPLNGSVSLTWTAPSSNGGSPVTGYVITPYIGGSAQASINTGNTNLSRTVTGLSNGTTYTFTVAAKNVAGTGTESAASIAVTAGAPSAPGFQSAQPGNASAKVGWTAPGNNGSPVIGYRITPFIGSVAQPPQTFNTTATSDIVTGLVNGTTYTFAVAAINGNGTGAEAVTAPIIVGTPTAPGFPRAIPGTNTARVSWSSSVANGAPIQGYVVTPFIGSVAQPPQTFNSTGTTQTVTGLTSGVSYSFKVAGFNSIGTGPVAVTGVIIEGSPAVPGFQSAAPGNASAKVQYLAPASNSAPITSFTVWPVQGSTVLAPQVFNTPSALTLTVTGLTNGVTYSFRVAATNSVGTGPYATTNTVIAGTPTSPAFPSAQPGNGTARVAWSAANANGSAITGHVVTPYVGTVAQPAQVFGTGTSATLTGLTNGTTYTFKVAAINAVGTGPESATVLSIKVGTPASPGFPGAAPLDSSAKVTYQAAVANGSPVTGYIITPVKGTTVQPSQTFNNTNLSQIVTGLANGSSYTFRVQAINAVGTGPYGTTAAITVGVPSNPTGVSATTGVGQATVNWTAPAANGSPITGYTVTPYIAGVAQAPRVFASTATSQAITGLVAGTAYTFKVQATNAVGTSSASATSNSVTPT